MNDYVKIRTFEEDAYKSYIREGILNPLIVQHNSVCDDLTKVATDLSDTKVSLVGVTNETTLLTRDVEDLEVRVFELEKGETSTVTHFVDLADAPRHLECGKFLKANHDGTRLEFVDISASGSGAESFIGLSDTPASYADAANKIVKVNALGNGLVFETPAVVEGVESFVDLSDTPAEITPNKWLKSNASGTLEFADLPDPGISNTFLGLSDTPSSIMDNKILVGDSSENRLIWADMPTGGGSVGPEGPAGPAGPAGEKGDKGDKGDPGEGIPAGGTAGQVLSKIDGTDYNAHWIDASETEHADLDMISVKVRPFLSKVGTYTTQELVDNVFINARSTQTITLPKVTNNPTGPTEVNGGEVRYICAYEGAVTLQGAQLTGNRQNFSYGGVGEESHTIPRGATIGIISVAIDEGTWSNWQVFSEVASKYPTV